MPKNLLNQFGAILSFAIDLETKLSEYYQNQNLIKDNPSLNSEFEFRVQSSLKRVKNLERARRENVTEITLEPITGLDPEDYNVNFVDFTLKTINFNTASTRKFYEEAGPKLNVREVNRLFLRYLKEYNNLQNLT